MAQGRELVERFEGSSALRREQPPSLTSYGGPGSAAASTPGILEPSGHGHSFQDDIYGVQ
jgi:hypothetical protein